MLTLADEWAEATKRTDKLKWGAIGLTFVNDCIFAQRESGSPPKYIREGMVPIVKGSVPEEIECIFNVEYLQQAMQTFRDDPTGLIEWRWGDTRTAPIPILSGSAQGGYIRFRYALMPRRGTIQEGADR